MSASGRQDVEGGSAAAHQGSSGPEPTRGDVSRADSLVGSPEHLNTVFTQAASVADRAVGLWLARTSSQSADRTSPPSSGDADELRALRAMVRAAATAYVRRLRAEGTTPERMLVLVKSATSDHGSPGFGAQELTNDIVRWSIEAYFE